MDQEDYIFHSNRLRFNKKTNKHELTNFHTENVNDDNSSNYTALITKTTDGGKTWEV